MSALYHVTQLLLFPSKVCKKCGKEKLLDDFELRADTHKYRSDCKVCRKAYIEEYQASHREQIAQRKREYADAHYEHLQRYQHEWYMAHREDQLQKCKERQIAKCEHLQRYYHDHYLAHREEHLQKGHEYHASHQAQIRLRYQEYYALNQQDYVERARCRRVMQRGATIGEVNYERILERDGAWCYICERAILPDQELHFDHVIPITRGGAHVEENIKPTHKVCNLRKYTRLLSEMTVYQRRGIAD